MGKINMAVGQINITNYLMINVREAGAPTVIVASRVIPPPVPTSQNIVFTGLNNVNHFIDIRSSPDGVSLGLLLDTFNYNVREDSAGLEFRFYKGGGLGTYDPAPGTNVITDPYLDGKTILSVDREGFRFLKPNEEFMHTGDTVEVYQNEPPVAVEFGEGERIVIVLSYPIPAPPSSSGQSFPIDFIDLDGGDIVMNSTHFNKVMVAQSSATILTVTFPSFSTIPDKTRFGFNTHNADFDSGQRYMKIVIDGLGVNYLQHRGEQKAIVWMGKGETLEVQKKGTKLYVIDWDGDQDRIGEIVATDTPPINSVAEVGFWADFTEYGRFYEEFVKRINMAYLGTATYPSTPDVVNKTKWIIDAVNSKFWVPDTRGMFIRNYDNVGLIDPEGVLFGRLPGGYQPSQVGQFSITFLKGNGFTGNPSAGDVDKFGYGGANPQSRTLTFNSAKKTFGENVARIIYRII